MNKNNNKINFIKAVYGKEAFDSIQTIKYLDQVIVGWVVNEYPTLKELEAKFSDEDILELHKQVARF